MSLYLVSRSGSIGNVVKQIETKTIGDQATIIGMGNIPYQMLLMKEQRRHFCRDRLVATV